MVGDKCTGDGAAYQALTGKRLGFIFAVGLCLFSSLGCTLLFVFRF